MRIGAIIQARMNSQRFPGKVLYKVAGKPLLQYLLERLDHCNSFKHIVVATSIDHTGTQIVDFCKEHGVAYYRGSLLDVAGRFKAVLGEYGFEAFVRVNGDSPLLDQRLIERGVDLFLSGDYDIVTNVWPRTYPSGQSVEILRSEAYHRGYRQMKTEEDLEHVTRFFYRNQEDFRIFNFVSDIYYGKVHLSVDTVHDFEVFTAIVSHMTKPHWEYSLEEIIQLCQAVIR